MQRNLRGTWRSALLSLCGSIAMILGVRWAFFEPYVIPSGSMIPSLLIHDHILVNKFSYGLHVPFSTAWIWQYSLPERGDVIVFRSVEDEGTFLVKRVIGLPGDEIRVTASGQLMINNQLIERRQFSHQEAERILADWPEVARSETMARYDLFTEKFTDAADRNQPRGLHLTLRSKDRPGRDQGPYEVPPGELFMMGDNRDNSSDSRVWGTLPISRVLGRASFIWLSCEETLPDATQLCDPKQLRWSRLAKAIQ